MPPALADQLVEPGILDAYRPRQGMVIVSGATGSGKSTLIAGMTVAKLLDPEGNFNMVEGAAPVEFLLERVRGPSSTINQTEIPRDLPTFAAFVRGAMRREPTDIIVGECRDSETMDAAIQAAISGHVLTTTVHANDVALTMQRIASLCPPAERENLVSAVAQSLRLVINQRLARSTDGRRTALREFLVFDAGLRGAFLGAEPSEWPALTRRAVEEQGQSYRAAIEREARRVLVAVVLDGEFNRPTVRGEGRRHDRAIQAAGQLAHAPRAHLEQREAIHHVGVVARLIALEECDVRAVGTPLDSFRTAAGHLAGGKDLFDGQWFRGCNRLRLGLLCEQTADKRKKKSQTHDARFPCFHS